MSAFLHTWLMERFLARDGMPGLRRHLAELRANETLPPAELARLQTGRLKRLLVHARDHCPFYAERFAACGLVPEDVASAADLAVVPPLTKHDIREHLEALTADNIPADARHESVSGGTTGHVLHFRRDNACLGLKEAAVFRYEQWTGWDIGQWVGFVWPALMDFPHADSFKTRLRNRLGRRSVLLAFVSEDREQIRDYWRLFLQRRITLIRAFPGALVSVARLVEEEGLPLPPLKAVISTGELLRPDQRELFARVFACPVIDSYRSRETGPVAQQCERMEAMHIRADLSLVEVDAARTVAAGPGQPPVGPLLVTDLLNYAMPMIRYEVGDLGALDPEPCACGRTLPLLSNVGGRLTDVLYTVDRRPIAAVGMVPNFILPIERGNQMQLVQRAWDLLLVRLTPPLLDADTVGRLQARAEEIFGPGIRLEFEYVDEIPLLPSGKYRLLACEIPQGERP